MWIEYGKPVPKLLRFQRKTSAAQTDAEQRALQNSSFGAEVKAEAERVHHSDDALRVLDVTKIFPGRFTAVDDVSFGVGNETFAMLGPNGAGKTTTFNIIRGDIRPTKGDVLINGLSIVNEPASARVSLGVTPQFSAADSQLTVREHMMIYGSLKVSFFLSKKYHRFLMSYLDRDCMGTTSGETSTYSLRPLRWTSTETVWRAS